MLIFPIDDNMKPSLHLLKEIQKWMEYYTFLLGKKTWGYLLKIYNTIPEKIEDVSTAMKWKLRLTAERVLPHIINEFEWKKDELTKDEIILKEIEKLIIYWYIKRWIPPLYDYDKNFCSKQVINEEKITNLTIAELIEGKMPPQQIIFWFREQVFLYFSGNLGPKDNKSVVKIKAIIISIFYQDRYIEKVDKKYYYKHFEQLLTGCINYWLLKHWIFFPFITPDPKTSKDLMDSPMVQLALINYSNKRRIVLEDKIPEEINLLINGSYESIKLNCIWLHTFPSLVSKLVETKHKVKEIQILTHPPLHETDPHAKKILKLQQVGIVVKFSKDSNVFLQCISDDQKILTLYEKEIKNPLHNHPGALIYSENANLVKNIVSQFNEEFKNKIEAKKEVTL